MIFDSHAHYDDKKFDEDREMLLSSMEENGISRIVNVGADIVSSRQTIALTEKYSFIYGAVGVHPSDVDCLDEESFQWIKEQSFREKIVAIGEIGLDYYWEKDAKKQEQQKYWFRRQLNLAREVKLPVIIHSRDAAADTLQLMKEEKAEEIPGVIHCFSYSPEMAMEYVKMGYYIGIGGVLTFKNAKKLKEVAAVVPMERILLETDCPYLAPEPNRGKRNSSLNLTYVIQELAAVRNMEYDEIEKRTYENACRLYFGKVM